MANAVIQEAFSRTGVLRWKVADALHIHPGTLSTRLRHELPTDAQAKILAAIRAVAGEAVKTS